MMKHRRKTELLIEAFDIAVHLKRMYGYILIQFRLKLKLHKIRSF